MAQFVVRNLEDWVKKRLRRRARQHGRSLEEEVRDILRNAVRKKQTSVAGLGTEIAALFSGIGLDSDVNEFRGHSIVRR